MLASSVPRILVLLSMPSSFALQTVLAAQNRADFVALELELSQPKFKEKDGSASRRKIEPWCFPVSIIAFLVLLLICIPMFGNEKIPDDNGRDSHGELCNVTCRILFHPGHSEQENSHVETKPFTRWNELMALAESTIDLLIVYSKCRKPSHLKALPVDPAIRIRVILLLAQTENDLDITCWLDLQPNQESHPDIRTLSVIDNFQRPGLYSLPEMVLVDQAHFAISSSTMPLDYQKDNWVLGAHNCSCSSLVPDLQRVFQTYWYQAQSSVDTTHPVGQNKFKERMTVPDPFDSAFPISMTMPFVASSSINVSTSFHYADQRMSSRLPSAFPFELLTNVEAICAVLHASREFLYISVVKYQPQLSPRAHEASSNSSDTGIRSTYWAVLDSALRVAFVSRSLDVRMLVLSESRTDRRFLRSLKALDGLNGNSFRIKIRNTRSQETVNSTAHQQTFADNFVTTANAAHFGTSSWDGKSLTQLPGLGLTVLPADFCQEHSQFCSLIRGQRELASLSSDKPAASGSRSPGSARAAAPSSQRHRAAKDQQKPSGYPSYRRSSPEIESQKSLIAELKTLFETQWDRPDANEL
ncbi:hypothetical protein RvY_14945-3 [Ramazzottius varieornatus]|nr:hypothetical protein RvY_14945-3 [Ramazzottius varieornatus]